LTGLKGKNNDDTSQKIDDFSRREFEIKFMLPMKCLSSTGVDVLYRSNLKDQNKRDCCCRLLKL
jgi:hypothetical protein